LRRPRRGGRGEPQVTALTGLLVDPYFSATKLAWLLDNMCRAPGGGRARRARLRHGRQLPAVAADRRAVHATEATNASRTMLFDIRSGDWDDALLRLFRIPRACCPRSATAPTEFGLSDPAICSAAPCRSRGIAGDQQAATIGQACFAPGMVKSTYGTGCFALLNTGESISLAQPAADDARLSTAAVAPTRSKARSSWPAPWCSGCATASALRRRGRESGELAQRPIPRRTSIWCRPSPGSARPTGMRTARGAIYGLTLGSGPAELARAALEAVCYQTHDLLEGMRADWHGTSKLLRADGGMAASDWTMQRLADILGLPVDRPQVIETTALGAAYLAGYQAGVYPPPDDFAKGWAAERRFEPAMDDAVRARKLAGWTDAVARTLSQ
jgi:glycerol kinase